MAAVAETIESLRVNWSYVGDVRTLATTLKTFAKLKSLDLSGSGIGDKGAMALAPALKAFSGLESLSLQCNQLGEDAARALTPALRSLTGLKSLDLRHNEKMAGEGTEKLKSALGAMSGLECKW